MEKTEFDSEYCSRLSVLITKKQNRKMSFGANVTPTKPSLKVIQKEIIQRLSNDILLCHP